MKVIYPPFLKVVSIRQYNNVGVITLTDNYKNDRFLFLFDLVDYELVKSTKWVWNQRNLIRKSDGKRFVRLALGVKCRDVVVLFKNGDRMDARRLNLEVDEERISNPKGFEPTFFGPQGSVLGIYRVEIKGTHYWTAQIGSGQNRKRKHFSVAKLGEKKACSEACKWRVEVLASAGKYMTPEAYEELQTAIQYDANGRPFHEPFVMPFNPVIV